MGINKDGSTKKLVLLAWYGGKSVLLDDIYPFPEHKIFVDVFGGGCTVLLNKSRSITECFNDINGRLINFFRVLQNQWMELEFLIKYKCPFKSRELFEKYKEQSDDLLEDAVRFFYVNTMSFSGSNKTLSGINRDDSRNFQFILENKIKRFPDIAKRIKGVIIENQDFRKIIQRFDSINTLFYCDPPYNKGGERYEKMIGNECNNWTEEDYEELWDILISIKGKFVLSFDKIPQKFKEGYYIQPIERYNYSISAPFKNTEQEYIIRNFTNTYLQKEKLEKNGDLTKFGFTIKKSEK